MILFICDFLMIIEAFVWSILPIGVPGGFSVVSMSVVDDCMIVGVVKSNNWYIKCNKKYISVDLIVADDAINLYWNANKAYHLSGIFLVPKLRHIDLESL